MSDVILGIDLGYGRVKIAGPGGWYTDFPAVVANPTAMSDPSWSIVIDGRAYVVGDDALEEPNHRMSGRIDKAAQDDERAKYLAALALAARHYGARSFTVATGLPPFEYKVPGLKDQLKERLSGRFVFGYAGGLLDLTVEDVQVLPQGGAAYFDFLLDGQGNIANPQLEKEKLLILDPGHRTTDGAATGGRPAAATASSP